MKNQNVRGSFRWCLGLAIAAVALRPLAAVPVTFNLETATLEDVQAAMEAGALTSVEMTAMYLNRIETYSQSGPPFLNAIMISNPNVLEDAAEADRLRARGTVLGPLHGVPYVLKGSYGVMGFPMTGGFTGWLDQISPFDCFVQQRLKAAGAVFLGYANMDTFASSAGSTNSQVRGTTLNAYVAGYSASGSSGGSGVSAGANLAFFSWGGETGGSIRGPSDRAGVVGFKVNVGTNSVAGILALVAVRDVVGPMTRYVKDNATIMDIASVYDPNDIWVHDTSFPSRPRASGFVDSVNSTSLAGKRFAVIRNWVGTPYEGANPPGSTSNTTGLTTPTADVLAAFNEARAALVALGAEVVETQLPPEADTSYSLRHPSVPAEVVTPPTRTLTVSPNSTNVTAFEHKTLLESLNYVPGDTPEELAAKVRLRANTSAGNISDTTYNAMYTFDADGMIVGSSVIDFNNAIANEYFEAQRYIITDLENWMEANGFDAIIQPTSTSKTRTGNSSPGGLRDIVNNMGLPMLTVPMGVLDTGEPITLAFVGKFRADAEITGYAYAYEQATNKRIVSTLVPALPGESFVYDPDAPPAAPPRAPGAPAPETVPPVTTVAGSGKIVGKGPKAKLTFRGIAADASGIARIEVTINGRKIPVKIADGKWTATVPAVRFRGQSKVRVVVLATDSVGNTAAKRSTVRLPAVLRS